MVQMTLIRYALIAVAVFSALPASGQVDLLVGEKVSHSVGFYRADGSRIVAIPVGKHPHEMALSPDGKQLYVSDNGMLWMTDPGAGGNTISIIDVGQRKRTGVIDLGTYRRPHGLDVDPRSGRLVVTVENPDGLLLVDPKARKVVRFYELKGGVPHMVKLSADGEWAYCSNTGTGTLAAIRLETGEIKPIAVGARPQGSVLSKDGTRVYVTNSDGNSISIIDTRKQQAIGKIETGKGPGRIWLTPDEKQLVYNLQPGEAVGFADVKSGKQIATVALPGPPLSLNLSPDGTLGYASVQSLDKICVISIAARKIVRVLDTPKGAGPDAVIVLK
jgi:YVTN family beta-propeller protein